MKNVFFSRIKGCIALMFFMGLNVPSRDRSAKSSVAFKEIFSHVRINRRQLRATYRQSQWLPKWPKMEAIASLQMSLSTAIRLLLFQLRFELQQFQKKAGS